SRNAAATTRSASPSARASSVVEDLIVTIRSGREGTVTSKPQFVTVTGASLVGLVAEGAGASGGALALLACPHPASARASTTRAGPRRTVMSLPGVRRVRGRPRAGDRRPHAGGSTPPPSRAPGSAEQSTTGPHPGSPR